MSHKITVGEELKTDTELAAVRRAMAGFPATPPTVTGAKGGNVALTNLIAALVTAGLIVDGTS